MMLMFKYQQGGESKRLLINAEETGITFNYSEFMYKSSTEYYGWKDITASGYGKYYCQQGDSWLEQYHAGSLSSVFNFTGENVMKLTGSDSFHGSGTDQWSNGIEMTYGENGGTCKFSWYTFTDYTPDPVSYIVSGGLFDFCPDGDTIHKYGTAYPSGSASGYGNVYTTESAPSIAFWTAKMYDDYNTDREEYHKTFDVLIIAISASTYEGSTQRAMFTIVDMRLLNGANQIKPSKSTAKGNTPMGFRGDRNDHSDSDIESHIGLGFREMFTGGEHGVRIKQLGHDQVQVFYNTLWQDDLWENFQQWKWNPIGCILGLQLMPCDPEYVASADSNISIAGYEMKYEDGETTVYAQGKSCANYREISTRIFNPKEYSGSFLDWGKYTTAVFRLPFVGMIPIDISKIRSGGVFAKYNIDFYTGNCLVQIYTIPSKDVMGEEGDWDEDYGGCLCMIGQYAGNCAHKIAVSGNDYGAGQVMGSIVSAVTSTASIAANVAGGQIIGGRMGERMSAYGILGGVGGIANAVGNAFMARHNISIIPATPNADTLGMMEPALILERPIDLTPLDEEGEATVYEHFNGRSSCCGGTVKDYKELDDGNGVYIAGVIHADLKYATENEKQEIERAFAKGVYI